MNIEAFREYCMSKKGVTEAFPFDADTLVFKVMGKMFAVCGLERVPLAVNLKCDPDRSVELREMHDGAITPGWHMNKTHWNTCVLESLPVSLLIGLTDHSYNLVVSKMTKKLQAELKAL